ncbi:hypothetical protein ACQCP7_26220, partial [Ralstonia pseudosolanacearum]|uniref:hypothetical protein n=1 Tax=Ralstonia pseudosolanacearum TaxID=1310165 RepID=UPI003CF988B6
MAIQNITYNTKEALQDDETIPVENKVTADDMNEIKAVVNNNASETEVNTQNIENLDTNKVDKQIGKGLSTNDYTNEEEAQLSTYPINI